jgi:hypothetical protein
MKASVMMLSARDLRHIPQISLLPALASAQGDDAVLEVCRRPDHIGIVTECKLPGARLHAEQTVGISLEIIGR